ncbi:unnamed protein product [Acidithrix sp. C25]|nr:unnamed protein product [Acidithrix sp. C25]
MFPFVEGNLLEPVIATEATVGAPFVLDARAFWREDAKSTLEAVNPGVLTFAILFA